MIQFTLVRPGPRQYVLNRATHALQATVVRRVIQVAITRSVVVLNTGNQPIPTSSAQQWATLNW